MGRNGHGPKWLWAEMVMGRNDPESSRVVLSRPMTGPFATPYFSHLFYTSRFANSVIFAVCCQLTVNFGVRKSFIIIN